MLSTLKYLDTVIFKLTTSTWKGNYVKKEENQIYDSWKKNFFKMKKNMDGLLHQVFVTAQQQPQHQQQNNHNCCWVETK